MIKTGINVYDGVTPELVRLLMRHPDVDIKWIADDGRPVSMIFDSMLGTDNIPVFDMTKGTPDLRDIDLYIGYDSPWLKDAVKDNDNIKVIFSGIKNGRPEYDNLILGVCEYNRKAMVRDGRFAFQPDVPTLLGAIALMPLAKHLMLNSPISGMMIVPDFSTGFDTISPYDRAKFTIFPAGNGATEAQGNGYTFDELKQSVLAELQSSFNTTLDVSMVRTAGTDFACAVLTIDIKMPADQALQMYKDFYSDHRHIFFPEKMQITDRMVRGSNNTAVAVSNDSLGRLVVTVGFDSRYKAGAGNIMHIMNLLFGLDERTGF